jgi:5-methylcytosine-specific restriction endonuclease McrA
MDTGTGTFRRPAKKRKMLSYAFKMVIVNRDSWTCWYCGVNLRGLAAHETFNCTVDHIQPVIRGGNSEPSNLVAACRTCNIEKSARTLEEYREYRRYAVLPEGQAIVTLKKTLALVPPAQQADIQKVIDDLEAHIGEIRFYGEGAKA